MNDERRYARILEIPARAAQDFSMFSVGETVDLLDKVDDTAAWGALYRVRKNGIERLFFGHEIEVL